jgi:hypothetical protein
MVSERGRTNHDTCDESCHTFDEIHFMCNGTYFMCDETCFI